MSFFDAHGGDIYRHGVRLDFSVNTSPLGINPSVCRAVIKNADCFGVYPDADCSALREKIALYEGVDAQNIVCSNGASEMIFAAVRAAAPKKALVAAPTFSEYARALKSVGCDIKYYSLSEENEFRLTKDFPSELYGTDMVFLCNPNNPTGKIIDKKLMIKITEKCAETGTLCIVDECFMDLADGYSMKGGVPVIKAFTKTFAMAGLRLGYLIGDTKFVGTLKQQLPVWNVSAPAQAAGIAALCDTEYIGESIKIIKNERAYLENALNGLGFKVFPSDVNFILFKGGRGIADALLSRGILIRDCSNFVGLAEGFYRVAVKRHAENEELIKELGEICG